VQYVLHVAAAGITGPNRIHPASQGDLSCGFAKIYYDFNLGIESVHMNGLVILRIRDKSHSVKPYRPHASRIRL